MHFMRGEARDAWAGGRVDIETRPRRSPFAIPHIAGAWIVHELCIEQSAIDP